MPVENTVTRPLQKTIDFVDGLKGKLPDEELAVIKRYVDKRSREATQAQVTVTPDDTVQHCSPCSPNPDMPSDVCLGWKVARVRWAQAEGAQITIGWYGSRYAQTTVSPERGDMGDRTNHRRRLLFREREFKPRGKHIFTYDGKGGHASRQQKYENYCRHLFDSCNPGKPQAQDN